MRLLLIFSLVFVSLITPAATQMIYFDSILYCASSFKTLIEDCKEMGQNYHDSHALINTASKALKKLPELLDNCGKQVSAMVYRTLLSRECINLHQLQASFTVKVLSLIKQSPTQNSLLIQFYTDMINIINKHEQKQCGFFNLELKHILHPLKNSQCIIQGQDLLNAFKDGIANFQNPTPQSLPIFSNIPLLVERLISTSKVCISEYNEYFPIPCVNEVIKVARLASTMSEYRTAASWIWDHVRELKASFEGIKNECPKLLLLLL